MPSLTDLASHFGGEVVGNGNVAIDAVASLSEAKAGQLSFYESSLPKQVLLESKAAAVLLKKEVAADCPCRCGWCQNHAFTLPKSPKP